MSDRISLKNVIEESFSQYAGAVIQSRALPDVRDCIKPSARQIYYCLYTDNFVAEKPFKKTLKAIGSAMRVYIHGDSSCEGIIMRSGQPFAMRYPLIEVEGSYGNLMETGNWAAPRYTSSRLSSVANYLLKETKNYSIDEWVDNYDDTEKYPRVLSSLGFYNIVNGTSGIAVGASTSIPQFNLREVNDALIKIIKNPDIDFDEIYCAPDFATGGTIINEDEVKESLRKGKGKTCIVQATFQKNEKENTLIVTELPYGVYTNTICKEIEKYVAANPDCGIVGVNDLTGEDVCIKIYLNKKTDLDDMINTLYYNTSLQKSISINMTMLEDGRFPKVFGWKEALIAHLQHEEKVYKNVYTHQLKEFNHKLKINQAILAATTKIDEVIQVIRQANSNKEANLSLRNLLNIDEEQAKAILDIRLAKLAKIENEKYLIEKENLVAEITRIEKILCSDKLLKEEMIKRFQEVSKKIGDARRTQVIQKEVAKAEKKQKEKIVEDVVITFNPLGYIQNIPVVNYKKSKYKAFKITTEDLILLFSNTGKFYRISPKDVKKCGNSDKGTAIGSILKLENGEKILDVFSTIIDSRHPYLTFCYNNGIIKKSEKVNYLGTTRNLNGMLATKIKDNEIIGIQETNGDNVILGTEQGYYIKFNVEEVRATGKASAGVKGIALGENDKVIEFIVSNDEKVQTKKGLLKLKLQKRGGKGQKN